LFYNRDMNSNELIDYNNRQSDEQKRICEILMSEITTALPEATSKLYHASPVWFIDGNPIVGYNVNKGYVQLLFWSGQSFGDSRLRPQGKFKAAGVSYGVIEALNIYTLRAWLKKSATIQWDYKNLVSRGGELRTI